MSDSQISEFIALTGASTDQAKFFLESSGGDVQLAINTYLESAPEPAPAKPVRSGPIRHSVNEDEDEEDEEENFPPPPRSAPSAPSWSGGGQTLGGGSSGGSGGGTGVPDTSSFPAKKPPPSSGGRIATLSGLSSGPSVPPPSSPSSDSDDPPNLFAGGERSGLSIQNPNRRGRDEEVGGDVVKAILEKAKRGGEKKLKGEEEEDWGGKPAGKSWFGGTGNTVGSEDEPSRIIGPSGGSGSTSGSRMPGTFGSNNEGDDDDEREQPVSRTLTFWKEGFSVEDGPLMRYDEPGNRDILEAIQQGRAPLSLLNVKFNQPVELVVARRMNESYVPPPKVTKPFEGTGNRLGAPTSVASTSSAPSTRPPPQSISTRFQVDNNQPTTNLQIRLGDGTRMVGRFNHTHTVGDIRQYIDASQTGTSRAYVLQTTFPTRELTDLKQSIKDAGLLGSVIVQKWV